MKKTYVTPNVEIIDFASDRFLASMNFGTLKDAAQNGGGSAMVVSPTSEASSDVYMPPRY